MHRVDNKNEYNQDEIWHRKMCHANNKKRKRHKTEGIDLLIKAKSDHFETKKLKNTWGYLKWTPLNKWR